MKQCPKCNGSSVRKDGKVKQKQRYLCLTCHYRYTVQQKSTARTISTKRNALILYISGLGFRSIGRCLDVSHVSVYQWLKEFTEVVDSIKDTEEAAITDMTEVCAYIDSHKFAPEHGLLVIGMGKDGSTVLIARPDAGSARKKKKYLPRK